MLLVKNLTLSVKKRVLCRDLNLDIRPGEIWGILGPNGCGKTTLLLTIAGLIPTDSDIFLHGEKLSSLSCKTLARQVGILFQDSHDVFPQTVYDFCSSGRFPYLNHFGFENDDDKTIVQQALQIMELATLQNQNIQHLSGGERRRLRIATLIAQAPAVYLLDEPTNHLDLRYQMQTLTYLRTLVASQAKAVCMSLHDINLAAAFCDKILLLTGKEHYLSGTTQNILTEENLSMLYQQPLTKRMGFYPSD